MKKILLLTLLYCLITIPGFAQVSSFLFPEFTDAVVVYKDGRVFNVKVNYNLISRQFLFIDTNDKNTEKVFAEPGKVSAVRVGERTFQIPGQRGAIEVIQFNPPFFVEYRGELRQSKRAGYGGRSETSSIQNYSSYQADGRTYNLPGEDPALSRVNLLYQVYVGSKKKHFSNQTGFLKLYPKKKEELQEYIKANRINFQSIDEVLALYNYAESLTN